MLRRIAVALILVFSLTVFFPTRGFSQQDETQNKRRITYRVEPQYPALARTMDLHGTVRVEVLVSSNGSAKTTTVKGGHPLLARAALGAVREWKWEAAAKESTEVIDLRF
jgi:TonB family protein